MVVGGGGDLIGLLTLNRRRKPTSSCSSRAAWPEEALTSGVLVCNGSEQTAVTEDPGQQSRKVGFFPSLPSTLL